MSYIEVAFEDSLKIEKYTCRYYIKGYGSLKIEKQVLLKIHVPVLLKYKKWCYIEGSLN